MSEITKSRRLLGIYIGIGIVVLTLVGLWVALQFMGSKIENPPQDAIKQTVSFRLKWRYGGTSCGVLVAHHRGFFSHVGLNVSINQGGFEYDSKNMVVSGSDQIGLTGADELILARANGMPLVAIGADFQKTPCCILALKNSGVTRPQDFAGKRLGIRKAVNVEYQYDVLLRRLGLNRESVLEEPIKFDLTRVIEGHLDMWTTYISERPLAEAKGLELNTIWYADYGIQSYGNVVFTSESFLKEHPDIVRRFLKAYYQGWKWAMDNPDKVGEIVKSFNPEASVDTENVTFTLTIPLLQTEDNRPLGYMTEHMWQETQKILIESGQLQNPIEIEKIFTNEYLSND